MIEVVLNAVDEKKEKYPYLGVGKSGSVVLFYASKTGIQINKNHNRNAGYVTHDWIEEEFKPLQGSITLSNA